MKRDDSDIGTGIEGGRVNQKRRTRAAIVDACQQLIEAGSEVNMARVAEAAGVSEATAYRYFPDLISLLRTAMSGRLAEPAAAMAPVEDSDDVVERISFATEVLLRHVHRYQSSVRAVIGATITRPPVVAGIRPGLRFGLIEHALLPLSRGPAAVDPETLAQLKLDLAVIVSAEAFFTLTDLCGLPPEQAIASAARTARTVTEAVVMSQPRSADKRRRSSDGVGARRRRATA